MFIFNIILASIDFRFSRKTSKYIKKIVFFLYFPFIFYVEPSPYRLYHVTRTPCIYFVSMVIAYKVKRNPSKTFHFHFYLLSGTIARNFIVHFSSYRFSCTALRVPIHRQFSFLPFGLRPKSGDTQLNFGRIIPGKKIRENRIRRRGEGYPVALSFYFATSSIFFYHAYISSSEKLRH